jgi:hypothetical protein
MDIKEAIILVEVNKPYSSNKGVYLNRDWAVLKCAELQSKATANQYYHLDTVPLYGDVEDPIIDIDRSGEEIVFTSSNGDSLYLYIKTSNEVYEERFHEEAFPHTTMVTVVDDILIHGTSISDLSLSDDIVRKIKHEADNYKEELNDE